MTEAANGSWPTNFRNLGDAINRAGDPDAPPVIDLGAGSAFHFQAEFLDHGEKLRDFDMALLPSGAVAG